VVAAVGAVAVAAVAFAVTQRPAALRRTTPAPETSSPAAVSSAPAVAPAVSALPSSSAATTASVSLPTAAASPSASPAPSLPPAAERVRGVYRIAAAYTIMNAKLSAAGGSADAKVGDKVPYGNWTITPACAGGPCTARVTSPDGFNYNLVLDHGHWRGRSQVIKTTCVGGPGTSNVQIDVDFVDPGLLTATAPPKTMSGRTVQHYGPGCAGGAGTATTSLVLTRIG
jgi:hypothetical protein